MNAVSTGLKTKSGQPLHPIGIGTWEYGEYPLFSPGTETEVSAIRYALSFGQNHIDTAEMYANGGAERIVGRAIESSNREDVFIASKLWKNHVADGTVQPAVEAMLKRLGTGYLDMLYIHAPWFDAPWQEAIPQINRLIDEGVVRYFGVSNFNTERLQEALRLTKYPIAADQLHYSFMHQKEASPELRKLCEEKGITVVAYMPLEKGDALKHASVKKIARRYKATTAQIALAWLVDRGTLPIPKSLQKTHISDNSMAQDIHLSREDAMRISALR